MVDDARIRKTKIKAREFFQTLAELQFESGYPYIMYEDTVNRANPIAGKITHSNLCSEILQVSTLSEFNDDLSYSRWARISRATWVRSTSPRRWIRRTSRRPSRWPSGADRGVGPDPHHVGAVDRTGQQRFARDRPGADEPAARVSGAGAGHYGSGRGRGLHQHLLSTRCCSTRCGRPNKIAIERAAKFQRASRTRSTPRVSSSTSTPSRCGSRPPTRCESCSPTRRSTSRPRTTGADSRESVQVQRHLAIRTCRPSCPPGRSPHQPLHQLDPPGGVQDRDPQGRKIGRVYYPAPYLTNDNLTTTRTYEIGFEKIIDTYAAATQHVDRGVEPDAVLQATPPTPARVNKAQIYAWRKGIKTLTTSGCGRWRWRAPRGGGLRQLHAVTIRHQRYASLVRPGRPRPSPAPARIRHRRGCRAANRATVILAVPTAETARSSASVGLPGRPVPAAATRHRSKLASDRGVRCEDRGKCLTFRRLMHRSFRAEAGNPPTLRLPHLPRGSAPVTGTRARTAPARNPDPKGVGHFRLEALSESRLAGGDIPHLRRLRSSPWL